jgi:septal ring factor EnvC (AmiA/AmiB activator)
MKNWTSRTEALWRLRRADPLEKENDALKTVIACLRTDMRNCEGQIRRFEVLVQERCAMIDALHARIDVLRDQNKKLEIEAEHLAALVAAPQPNAAILSQT